MLNMALVERGVVASGSHYEPKQAPVADAQQRPTLTGELNENNEEGVLL
jgi:hypothetical protein